MTASNLPRVIFFQVKTASEKLEKIGQTARVHFLKKEPFLILVDNNKGEQFVDELLWTLPKTSFLPHIATDSPSQEKIVITKIKKNLNQAHYVFNLCSTPLFIEGFFKIIYEFEDLTLPSKKNLSTLRFNAYKEAHFPIESYS